MGYLRKRFLCNSLRFWSKNQLAWGTPQECLKQGTHRNPPATVSTEIPGGRFEIAARTAVYCCVLLHATVYCEDEVGGEEDEAAAAEEEATENKQREIQKKQAKKHKQKNQNESKKQKQYEQKRQKK